MPISVFSNVDLPAPLRPSSATISCSCTSSDTRIEDVALAVERVDLVDREQRLGARRGGARLGGDRRGAGADIDLAHLGIVARVSTVPSTSTLPSFITVTWSAIWNTRSMSCSTSSTGISADTVFTSAAMRCALGRREPGQRLVEQQQARRGREREPHVEQPLAAIGQRGGLGALDAGEPEIADELGRLGR